MYERIKERSIIGYCVPDILDDTLCGLFAELYGIIDTQKYNAKAYGNESRRAIQGIRQLFSGFATTAEYKNKELLYALYYLPLNMFKIWVPLTDLLSRNALRKSVEVLELGAGPGTSTFGLLEFYRLMAEEKQSEEFSVSIDVVEKQQGFIDILKSLFSNYALSLPSNLKVLLRKVCCKEVTDNFSFLEGARYDLIYASNMFNYNETYGNTYFKQCCENLKPFLKDKSSLIIIEPGEKEISTQFKNSRNDMERQGILQVFSPCCCLHDYPHLRCEHFAVAHIRQIRSKSLNLLVDLGLNTNHNGTHAFDYVVFRNDNLKKFDIERKKRSKLCDIDWSLKGQTVNVTAIVLAENKNIDRTGLILCDGTISGRVWLNLSDEDIKMHHIQVDLIRGEKIDLKGAVISGNMRLEVTKRTEITVSF